jgi:hypothetical protein
VPLCLTGAAVPGTSFLQQHASADRIEPHTLCRAVDITWRALLVLLRLAGAAVPDGSFLQQHWAAYRTELYIICQAIDITWCALPVLLCLAGAAVPGASFPAIACGCRPHRSSYHLSSRCHLSTWRALPVLLCLTGAAVPHRCCCARHLVPAAACGCISHTSSYKLSSRFIHPRGAFSCCCVSGAAVPGASFPWLQIAKDLNTICQAVDIKKYTLPVLLCLTGAAVPDTSYLQQHAAAYCKTPHTMACPACAAVSQVLLCQAPRTCATVGSTSCQPHTCRMRHMGLLCGGWQALMDWL